MRPLSQTWDGAGERCKRRERAYGPRYQQKTAYEISECDWSSDVCSSDRSEERRGSEEHTSELQSHSEISYAVFCLKKKKKTTKTTITENKIRKTKNNHK